MRRILYLFENVVTDSQGNRVVQFDTIYLLLNIYSEFPASTRRE
jgi:hypothetical protein